MMSLTRLNINKTFYKNTKININNGLDIIAKLSITKPLFLMEKSLSAGKQCCSNPKS